MVTSSCHCIEFTDYDVELNQLTGIAAILTFPLDVEVVEAEEREAKEEEERQNALHNGQEEETAS